MHFLDVFLGFGVISYKLTLVVLNVFTITVIIKDIKERKRKPIQKRAVSIIGIGVIFSAVTVLNIIVVSCDHSLFMLHALGLFIN